MLRKTHILLAAIAFFTASIDCIADRGIDTKTRVVSYSYVPIEPIPVPKNLLTARGEEFKWKTGDNNSVLELLENEALIASVGQRDRSGNVNYFVADANVSIRRGIYTLDSVRYTAIPFRVDKCLTERSPTKTKVVFLLVGVGARAEIEFSSDRKSVDTSSLLKLGIQAESENVNGRINLRSLGVTSNSVSTLLALPSGLDFANVEATLRSLDAVKLIATVASAAPGSSIRVSPQIIAIDPADIPLQEIMDDIYEAALHPSEYQKRTSLALDSTEQLNEGATECER